MPRPLWDRKTTPMKTTKPAARAKATKPIAMTKPVAPTKATKPKKGAR